MKTSLADKIAIMSLVAAAVLTASGWVYAITTVRECEHLRLTTYARPLQSYDAAMSTASSNADDATLSLRK
jgi:hypothetical protein